MAANNVLNQASRIVEDKLGLIQLLADDKKLLMDTRSRVVCRCASCRYENERTLSWLESLGREQVSAVSQDKSAKKGKSATVSKA
jgi:hypothetical protein